MDAGAIVYFSMIKDFAHIAGVYDVDDWMSVDARADRFRPLFNDEFGRDFLGELVGLVDLPSQHLSAYSMMQHSNAPSRYLSQLSPNAASPPGLVSCLGEGVTHHTDKRDRYTTTQGALSLAEYNKRAATFTPATSTAEYRGLSDSWIRWNADDPRVDQLYRLEQRLSRKLADRGAGLTREEVESARDDAMVVAG